MSTNFSPILLLLRKWSRLGVSFVTGFFQNFLPHFGHLKVPIYSHSRIEILNRFSFLFDSLSPYLVLWWARARATYFFFLILLCYTRNFFFFACNTTASSIHIYAQHTHAQSDRSPRDLARAHRRKKKLYDKLIGTTRNRLAWTGKRKKNKTKMRINPRFMSNRTKKCSNPCRKIKSIRTTDVCARMSLFSRCCCPCPHNQTDKFVLFRCSVRRARPLHECDREGRFRHTAKHFDFAVSVPLSVCPIYVLCW